MDKESMWANISFQIYIDEVLTYAEKWLQME